MYPFFNKNNAATIQLLVIVLCLGSLVTSAQNINTPNKIGPMGTEVNTSSGNLFIPRNDLYIPARGFDINLSFYYNSFNFDITVGFGKGWSCSYGIRYNNDTLNGKTIVWGDDREDRYKYNGSIYTAPKGFFNTLTQYQPNKYLLTELDGTKYYFDNAIHRKITKVEEPNGNYINFFYTDSLLTGITNTAGQSIALTYNANGNLKTVVDAITAPTRIYTYTYDSYGNLTKVTDPLGGAMAYSYLVNGPMKTMTDKNNNSIDIIYFNDYTISEIVGCNKRQSFSYDTTTLITVVTDYLANGNNQITTYEYQKANELIWLTRKTGNCCGHNMTFEYDGNGSIIKQTDGNGNVTSFTYDAKGNVLSVTDPLNQKMFYTYSNAFNNLVTSTDAKGNVRTMVYDSRGNLTQLVEPLGLTSSIAYNSLGDIIRITDPKGYISTFTYDAYGYLLTANAELGVTMSFVNDARGNVLSSADPRGFVSAATYDLLDRLKTTTDPYNHSNQLTYDAEGNLITSVNEKGQTSQFAYDASNRLVKITNALGSNSFLSYDAMDNLVKTEDALGNTSILNYNNLNRLVNIKDAVGDISSFEYDANGNMTFYNSATGRTVINTYDKLDRVIKSEDNNGLLGTVSYDRNGNVISATNATGAITTYVYDALDRLKIITDPLGNYTTYNYDNNSNIASTTDRNGNTMSYAYDALDRVINQTDNNGFITRVSYDASGNILSATDQNNRTTNYQYDHLDRLLKTIYPDNKSLAFNYDELGNLLSKQLTDGNTISYQYDAFNRMIGKTLPGNNNYTFQYDALDRMIAAINNTATVNIGYDAIGRVSSESLNGKTIRYSYNIAQRFLTTLYPDSTSIVKTFDTRGRLTGIAKNNSTIANYQYNNADQLIAKTFSNGITTNIQYNSANRLSNITTGTIQNSSYTFDKEWNKKSIIRNNTPDKSEEYGYDAGHRLTNAKRGTIGGASTINNTYTYDAVGNRNAASSNGINTNYTSNNLNQLTNSNNGIRNINFTYDDNGNLTYDGTFYKTYDAEGKILKDSASPTNKILYSYDALGRRTQKNVNGTLLNYVYAGLKQIEQRDGNTDTLLNRTVFGSFLAPIYSEKNNNGFYYHPNELNSVEAITNSTGNLVERYDYDAYGKQTIYDNNNTVQPTSIAGNRFGYTGQEFDQETESNHFHYRQYSPQTGTFNQRDPIGYADGMGMYQYVGNNPSNNIDMMGLWGEDAYQDALNEINNAIFVADKHIDRAINLGGDKAKEYFKLKQVLEKLNSKEAALKYSKTLLEQTKNLTISKMTTLKNDVQILGKGNKFNTHLHSLKKIAPFLAWGDFAYKLKKLAPQRDKCGRIIPRSEESRIRLEVDVFWSGMGLIPIIAPIMGPANLLDWATELKTNQGIFSRHADYTINLINYENANPNSIITKFNTTLSAPTDWLGRSMTDGTIERINKANWESAQRNPYFYDRN